MIHNERYRSTNERLPITEVDFGLSSSAFGISSMRSVTGGDSRRADILITPGVVLARQETIIESKYEGETFDDIRDNGRLFFRFLIGCVDVRFQTDRSQIQSVLLLGTIRPFLVGRRNTEYFHIPSQHSVFRPPCGCRNT